MAETEGGSRDARPALGLARPSAPRPPNAHREPAVPRAAPNAARGSIARARLPRVGRRGGRPRRPPHDGRPERKSLTSPLSSLFFSFIANVSKRTQLALPALALPAAWRAYGAGYLDKSEVTDRVVAVVKNFNKVDPAKVGPSSSFGADLGLDSLDTVEVVMAMEEEFAVEIPDAEADKITSVAEAVEYLAANPDAK